MYQFILRVFTTTVLGVLKNAICAVVFCDLVDCLTTNLISLMR